MYTSARLKACCQHYMEKTSHLNVTLAWDRWSPSVGSFPLQALSGKLIFQTVSGNEATHLPFTLVQLRGPGVSQNASYACSVLFCVTASRSAFEPGDVIVHACTTLSTKTTAGMIYNGSCLQWGSSVRKHHFEERGTSSWRLIWWLLSRLCKCVLWPLYNGHCMIYNEKAVELWPDTWVT